MVPSTSPLEFEGPGVKTLSMTDRFTIANMAIEAGAKNGIFPVDERTEAYIESRYHGPKVVVTPDPDARYAREVTIDLSSMKPVVSFPHLPENAKEVGTFGEIKIDQVVIGSCTNGRLEDLAIAASIIKGHKIHPDVRCIVIPATPQIYKDAMHAGYIDTFIDARLRRIHTDLRARALADTWASSHPEKNASPQRTETSSDAWVRPIPKFTWQDRRQRQPAQYWAASRRRRRSSNMAVLEGKIWRYGDNIDTDVIIPARYLNTFDPKELASHCMVDIDPTFAKEVKAGDIMVGGRNFGCGSSREHAPVAIKASGIPVIIAESFARIFYRNGINVGLPLLEIGKDVEKIHAGDILKVDLSKGTIEDVTTGDTFQAPPLPGFIEEIAKAGGLINYVKEKK